MTSVHDHAYPGARALVLLHERHMREFLATWRRAQAARIELPSTDDPSYASREALLVHVLRAARGYMVWMASNLGLPDPDIRPAPTADSIEAVAGEYLEHVLERWRGSLRAVPEERFGESYRATWGIDYCIDSMLEHAVMHPVRHTFQLEELMAG